MTILTKKLYDCTYIRKKKRKRCPHLVHSLGHYSLPDILQSERTGEKGFSTEVWMDFIVSFLV